MTDTAVTPGAEVAVPESREVVVPGTGELVDLTDAPAVARALQSLREFKGIVESARATLEAALVEESGRTGSKTMHLTGGLVARVGPDIDTGYDVTVLVELLDLGLPVERYEELVKTEVTFKVNAAVAKQIAGANPTYAAIIERAKVVTPKRPSVSVKPE